MKNTSKILDAFIENYNAFVVAANEDCGEEVFALLQYSPSKISQYLLKLLPKNIFKILFEICPENDAAIPFFSPQYTKKQRYIIIGYNDQNSLQYVQSESGEIFTTMEHIDIDLGDTEYFCAPNSEVFLKLLIIHLQIEARRISSVLEDDFLNTMHKKCLELVNNEKYSFFCSVICGI